MSGLVDSPDPIASSLNIMRRLPPNRIEQNLSGLLNLSPSITDELLQRVDQPLETSPASGRPFILSDYNRDGDSYRSPWTNEYSPLITDGFKPSQKLRDLEDKYVKKGAWNSIHVVEASPPTSGQSTYKLTTTIMVTMDTTGKECGATNLAGSMTRQTTQTCPVNDTTNPHLTNIGKMIEDMEIEMRSNMHGLYLLKTSQVVNNVRSAYMGPKQGMDHTKILSESVAKHGAQRKVDSES
ncbi:hypothetical protein TL16_g08965 [Triparma laevis f. inornata]|uniref:F-actin-capping protein subunit beta n=2 Tax=Triparma laevis TaxID=1534972 RepID=A0A9W7A6A9_9STRA|nr:hypothetical protein TrLO_g10127 [Triparma laevis f. longispina]GMH81546.1 hypothetical protein TL16_g08965 [Triparma laevis f. inornata]